MKKKQIKDWVHKKFCIWKGHVQKVYALYQGADIALLPSYREGLPKSLLEAASCGVPMVSTDVPGCREIVRHGKSGLLVPPKDSTALASALEKLIASPSLRKRMGATGRKDVEKYFSDDHIIKKTISLYGLR
ncbi:MAG: glycosyltransferase [Holosporaceae bacterium]|nr:MAG: glycosyltransferase [Holosporaceae bacterium]